MTTPKDKAPAVKTGKKTKTKGADHQEKPPEQAEATRIPRLRLRFEQEIAGQLMDEFKFSSLMQVPRLEKITINMGLGAAVGNPNIIKTATEQLSQLAGQRAVVTRAKKAIANFKLRKDLPIGCMVTLRRRPMWEFLDRLLSIAMPRIRDFKGVSGKAFDGHRCYSLGLREQSIFPEIGYDQIDRVTGMNITIVTTAENDQQCRALLQRLGMPFRN